MPVAIVTPAAAGRGVFTAVVTRVGVFVIVFGDDPVFAHQLQRGVAVRAGPRLEVRVEVLGERLVAVGALRPGVFGHVLSRMRVLRSGHESGKPTPEMHSLPG